MLIYILKSGACLGILFLFYKLFLEKENMHLFKRFYLLAALVISLTVPALVFTEYVEVPATTYTNVQPAVIPHEVINVPPALEKDVLDIAPILWGIYFIGLLFFGVKFIKNLFQIIRRIRKNPKYRLARFTQVLLQENFPPHTFFKYIFLNKKKLEANEIPKEVLLHEETHARQKHSFDVVFIEVLQVIFWFNPLVYLFKKAIKLNHEFLADEAVLEKDIDRTTYQNTLLSYLSPDSQNDYQSKMANAINYSSSGAERGRSIKKRFTIMKTHTSKKAVLLRSLLLLPLLAILLFGFSETKIETVIADPGNKTTFGKEQALKGLLNRNVELAGLILDYETLLPLKGVELYDSDGNVLSKTDDKGYYKVRFDNLDEGEIRFEYTLNKKGYKSVRHREHWGDLHGEIKKAYYFGLSKEESNAPEFSQYIPNTKNLSYESVLESLYLVENRLEFEKKITKAKKDNQNILIEIGNEYYLVSETGLIEINSKDDQISINDDYIVSASRLNNLIQRQEITGMTPLEKNKTALFAIYTIPVNSAVIPITKASESHMQKDSLEFIKDWYITIDEKKYYYLRDENRVWHYYDGNKKEVELDIVAEYKKKYSEYSSSKNSGTHYIYKSKKVQIMLDRLFSDLGGMYFRMSRANKYEVKRPSSPYAPYMKFVKNGKTVFKKQNELTEEDKKIFPSIAPAPGATSPAFMVRYNSLAKKYNAIPIENRKIPLSDLKLLETTYQKMSQAQKAISQPFPECLPKNSQDGVSRKLMAEYDALAKKYNTMLSKSKSIQIKKKDVDRLEYIFGLMSDKQKADAEPFPDFPEPPPPPKAPESPKVKKGEKSDIPPPPPVPSSPDKSEKETAEEIFQKIIANQDPYDFDGMTPIRSSYSLNSILNYSNSEERKTHIGKQKINERQKLREHFNIPIPPSPPTPKSPLDHVIEMAKKDARFYLEGKEISSDEAIELLKNNKDLTIDSRTSNGKRPVVKLSTEPITLDN